MASKRLSDEDIQAYLDKHHLRQDVRSEQEPQDEASARELRKYKVLYQRLSDEIELALPQDFAAVVMERIWTSGLATSWFDRWQLPIVIIGFLSGIGLTFFLGGFKHLSMSNETITKAFKVFSELRKLIEGLDINVGLIGAGLLILLLLSGIDHFLNSRNKLLSIFR